MDNAAIRKMTEGVPAQNRRAVDTLVEIADRAAYLADAKNWGQIGDIVGTAVELMQKLGADVSRVDAWRWRSQGRKELRKAFGSGLDRAFSNLNVDYIVDVLSPQEELVREGLNRTLLRVVDIGEGIQWPAQRASSGNASCTLEQFLDCVDAIAEAGRIRVGEDFSRVLGRSSDNIFAETDAVRRAHQLPIKRGNEPTARTPVVVG